MSSTECDLACQTKIIINGDNVAKLVETLCEQVEYRRNNDLPIPNGHAVIKALNDAEDAACKAQRLFLRGIGYQGPLPNSLAGNESIGSKREGT